MGLRDIAIIVLFFLLLCTTSACNRSDEKNEALADEYSLLETENSILEYQLNELKNEIEWLEEEKESTEHFLKEYENNFGIKIDGSEYYHKLVDPCDAVMNSSTFDFYDTSTYSIVYLDAVNRDLCPDCFN